MSQYYELKMDKRVCNLKFQHTASHLHSTGKTGFQNMTNPGAVLLIFGPQTAILSVGKAIHSPLLNC